MTTTYRVYWKRRNERGSTLVTASSEREAVLSFSARRAALGFTALRAVRCWSFTQGGR